MKLYSKFSSKSLDKLTNAKIFAKDNIKVMYVCSKKKLFQTDSE